MIKKTDINIAEISTFKNEGQISCLFILETIEEIREIQKNNKNKVFVLGKGSNTLINPKTTKTIIQISPNILPVRFNDNKLSVNAGISNTKLCQLLHQYGISGVEFIAGVPATVGGMVSMNFGCWGKSISNYVETVHIIDEKGNSQWLTQKEMAFGYRKSMIQNKNWVVVEATFKLEKCNPEKVRQTIQKNIQKRLKKQPLREATFGSIFMNPENKYAGDIIEKIGYKGKQYKHTKVSEKHANFMVNMGGTTYEDAITIIHDIQQTAKKNQGVNLELEVKKLD